MENIDDLELSELQELALRHQTVLPRKSLEEKCVIVKAHLLNHVPITQLSKEFGIPRVTIWRWIRTFATGRVPKGRSNGTPIVKPNPLPMPKKKQNPEENAAEELSRLREENKRLSEALKLSEWMNHAKDVMIDEAEKAFNIPIRKKSGAKQ